MRQAFKAIFQAISLSVCSTEEVNKETCLIYIIFSFNCFIFENHYNLAPL